jgi:hypothetical protein
MPVHGQNLYDPTSHTYFIHPRKPPFLTLPPPLDSQRARHHRLTTPQSPLCGPIV